MCVASDRHRSPVVGVLVVGHCVELVGLVVVVVVVVVGIVVVIVGRPLEGRSSLALLQRGLGGEALPRAAFALAEHPVRKKSR